MKKLTKFASQYSIIIFVAILMVGFTIGNPNFLKINNLITILRQSSMLGVVGVGMMLVMISGGVNLATGSIVSIVTVVIALATVRLGWSWHLSMFLSLIGATFFGWLTGMVIIKGRLNPLIGSMAASMALAGIAYMLCSGMPIYGVPQESKIFGQGFVWGIPVPVIIFVVVACFGAFLLSKTYLGRQLCAVGANEEAAKLSGLRTDFLHIFAYTMSGLTAGIAGIIMYGRVGSGQPSSGTDIGMNALIALVLGGVSFAGGEGKVINAMFGCVLMAMLINGLTLMAVDEYTQMVIKGMIFLGAVVLDSYQHRAKKAKKRKLTA